MAVVFTGLLSYFSLPELPLLLSSDIDTILLAGLSFVVNIFSLFLVYIFRGFKHRFWVFSVQKNHQGFLSCQLIVKKEKTQEHDGIHKKDSQEGEILFAVDLSVDEYCL